MEIKLLQLLYCIVFNTQPSDTMSTAIINRLTTLYILTFIITAVSFTVLLFINNSFNGILSDKE